MIIKSLTITIDPDICGGRPTISGHRLTVAQMLLAASYDELDSYDLEPDAEAILTAIATEWKASSQARWEAEREAFMDDFAKAYANLTPEERDYERRQAQQWETMVYDPSLDEPL